MIARADVQAGDVVNEAFFEADKKHLTLADVRVFDVYQGKPIADGFVSLALAFFFRHPERTLTDEEPVIVLPAATR